VKPKPACINCHFFVKQHQGPDGKPMRFHLLPGDKEAARRGDYSWRGPYALGCAKGVWDEGYRFDESRRHEVIFQTKRTDCFFLPFREGMMLDTAEELQKNRAATGEANRLRLYTVWGLWFGAISYTIGLVLDHWDAFRRGAATMGDWLGW
jgi:hypothetical protein